MTTSRNLTTRVLTGLVAGPLVLVCIYLGGLLLSGLIGLAALIGTAEFYAMFNRQAGKPRAPLLIGLTAAAALIVAGYIPSPPLYLAIFLMLALSGIVFDLHSQSAGQSILLIISAALYIAVPLSLCIVVRGQPDGLWWSFTVILTNWGTDSFAYICGRLFGRRKLAPSLSPNKTVEGAIGGGLLGAAIGIGFNILFNHFTTAVVIVSVLVAVSTLIGDLLESAIKRRFDTKDAGSILPGHGGILDRIDGLLVACVVVWLYLLVTNVATASM